MIRPATDDDAAAVAQVYLEAFRSALPTVRLAHSDNDVRAWIRAVVIPAGGCVVAEERGAVAAMMVLEDDWINQLYVAPAAQGHGLGGQLVDHAKRQRPDGLQLWTFQINERAQRFYQRQGFTAVRRTDGDNEEREPDVLYAWRPAQ